MGPSPRSHYATPFAIVDGLCIVILLPVLMTQVKVGTRVVVITVSAVMLSTILQLTNTLIWPQMEPPFSWNGSILCDIEVKLLLGLGMIIPGSLVCLFRQILTMLDSNRHGGVKPSKAEKRRTIIFETVFCAVLPLSRMALSYVVQPDRYAIYGFSGCGITVDQSWPSYALVTTWPLMPSVLAFCYGIWTTSRMIIHHHKTSQLFSRSSSLSSSRTNIIKTYIFATIFLLVNTPSKLWSFYENILPKLLPYSWSRVHPDDWADLRQIHLLPTRDNDLAFEVLNVVFSLVTFACFGLGQKATAEYKAWWQVMKRWAGHQLRRGHGGVGGVQAMNSQQGVLSPYELDTMSEVDEGAVNSRLHVTKGS